jgi:formylglycine-generating enzyme required for sulfatase activity
MKMQVLAFKMDETAVTNVEYLEFVKANPQWRKSNVNRLFADTNYLKYRESGLVIGKVNKNQNRYGLYDMHGLIWEWTSNFNSFVASADSRENSAADLKNFCAAPP